ncbi:MAG: hypothetical protein EB120_07980 [Proteobacteria bacterium]|nr:hypothetical protein [Pseudomonadota bacterium]
MNPNKTELVILMAILFFSSSAVIWVRTTNVKATYDYVQKETALQQLKNEGQELRVKWTRLTSPQRLATLGTQLSMTAPSLGKTLKYSSATTSPGIQSTRKTQ